MPERQSAAPAPARMPARLTRRRFVARLGAGAAAVALPILAACTRGVPAVPTQEIAPTAEPEPTTPFPTRVPGFRPGTRLAILAAGGASVAADDRLRALAGEWGREYGIEVTVEWVNAASVRARLASPQSLAGIDIVQLRDNLPWIHADLLADVSAEAEGLASLHGGFYDAPVLAARVEGVWRAVPFSVAPSAVIYRADWIRAAGAAAFPATTDELLTIGRALKAGGRPFGAPAGRSADDPRALWYAVLWAFGGRVTEADGRTIAINSPETVAALEWARSFWDGACLTEGLAWDDNGNNLAYANEQIAATQNGPSLYLKLVRDTPDLAAKSALAPFPAGPGGQAAPVTTHAHAVLKSSPNADAARALLTWLGGRAQTDRYLEAAGGAIVAALRAYEDSPVWARDPQLRAFLAAAATGRLAGWPAPPTRAATDADARFVVVDMFARVLAGKNAQVAIAEAEAALKGIFTS